MAVLLARLLLKEPLAFGESDVSKRIKNVLRCRKPRLISVGVVVLALAVTSLVCLTNASETTEQEERNVLSLRYRKYAVSQAFYISTKYYKKSFCPTITETAGSK